MPGPAIQAGLLINPYRQDCNNNNRAPYRYIGNAPVSTAGVAFPGYPATGAHAADSGRDTGPRTWWGVTCTPTETKPRQKENETAHFALLSRFHRRAPRGPCAHQLPQVGGGGSMTRGGNDGVQQPRANANGERRPVPHLPTTHRIRHRTYAYATYGPRTDAEHAALFHCRRGRGRDNNRKGPRVRGGQTIRMVRL